MRFVRYASGLRLLVSFLLSLFLITGAGGRYLDAADTEEPDLGLTAKACILIEASTGRVIYEQNADDHMYPASTTKMMTAVLALENLSLHTDIAVSPRAANTESSPLGLQAGDHIDAENLLSGMLTVSDNGAAVAVAERIDGNVPDFARRMNEKAQELGMNDTHFVNPNGLSDPDHYSTAHDIARLARYAMTNAEFRSMVRNSSQQVVWTYPRKMNTFENTNKLLGHYEGITGIKTGWTEASGGCLAASARRGGLELIAVVMGTPEPDDRFSDARKLLDYGFEHVKLVKGMDKERVQKRVLVADGTSMLTDVHPQSDIMYPLLHGESKSHYSLRYDLPAILDAPVKKNQRVGHVLVQYDGHTVEKVPLVADPVPKGFSLGSWLVSLFRPLFT